MAVASGSFPSSGDDPRGGPRGGGPADGQAGDARSRDAAARSGTQPRIARIPTDGGDRPSGARAFAALAGLAIRIVPGRAGAAIAAPLRARVFAGELGAMPDGEDDAHDATADHILAFDPTARGLGAVGALRVARGTAYTGREFDLGPVLASGRAVAEMGRLCLDRDRRGAAAGLAILAAAGERLSAIGAEVVVGTASFFGTDAARHGPALRALRAAALAPRPLRPRPHPGPCAVDTTGPSDPADMRAVPALVKSYLRAGAWVGDGAYVDQAFGCTDVCMILDLARLRLPRVPR